MYAVGVRSNKEYLEHINSSEYTVNKTTTVYASTNTNKSIDTHELNAILNDKTKSFSELIQKYTENLSDNIGKIFG